MFTASTALLDALHQCGVSCIFANFGSDHPALIEAMAEARVSGRTIPTLITCPNEMVALSAAHGYAATTGQAQCVLVHVECGTQALAGAIHNAAKGRAPVLIYAGRSPFTQEGELPGSRNEFIHWLQDVADQPGIVRGYVKYETEIRTGRNIAQLVARALQFAHSDPTGPVYLHSARETMEEAVPPVTLNPAHWHPIAPAALPPAAAAELADALLTARRPLVVTSYLGRRPAAVTELTALARRLGVGVLESVPSHLNFPTDDPLYQGNQWNQARQHPALAAADLVLVLDSDVPWIAAHNRPAEDARIWHIDCDPLKQQMPLWYIPANRVFRADVATALQQVAAAVADRAPAPPLLAARQAQHAQLSAARRAHLAEIEREPSGTITAEYVVASVRAQMAADAIVLSESITNYHAVVDHLQLSRPGSYLASGGGSLGWHGGAAIGVKLARPDREVIAFTGDGSYMFSVPSTVHWMARQYGTPFLTVVFNNRGWRAPKLSTLAVHPQGHASRANDLGVAFDPPPDYAAIAAAAGGALALTVKAPSELPAAIARALAAVRDERRCAVLDVWIAHL